MTATLRVATDVGGTFTDLVAVEIDAAGRATIRTATSDTTPPDFDRGVIAVIAKAGLDPAAIDVFAHGTTVVINALTGRKGVRGGLVTTQGFRDTLEIARGNRPDFFNLSYVKPPPFVSRDLRLGVPGRRSCRGDGLEPPDLAGLPAIVGQFRRDGVEAVAVSFLHGYANPAHQLAAPAELRRLWPGVPAVASHEIAREWREYERTATAVLSAYVQPVAERYLRALDRGLKARGLRGSPYIMQSNGGVDSLDSTARVPITMVESGPASGFWAAAELRRQLGRQIGIRDILALDTGGTTATCSLIQGGEVRIMML